MLISIVLGVLARAIIAKRESPPLIVRAEEAMHVCWVVLEPEHKFSF